MAPNEEIFHHQYLQRFLEFVGAYGKTKKKQSHYNKKAYREIVIDIEI